MFGYCDISIFIMLVWSFSGAVRRPYNDFLHPIYIYFKRILWVVLVINMKVVKINT